MKAKATVVIKGCSFEIGFAAGAVFGLYSMAGVDFIVTSAKDGTHGPGSLHAKGEAIDIRTRHLTQLQGDLLFQDMKEALEPMGFDVVDERLKPGAPHFHIEFQPKPGEHFIEVVA